MLTTVRSSKAPAPVLSDAGELRALRQKAGRWLLQEVRWDRTEHAIGLMRSACRPTLSAPQDKLIFVVGCTPTGGRWYRMLREDGHPLLKAEYAPGEIEQAAQAGAPGSFAVRVVQTEHPLSENQPFRPADLAAQSIALYSTANGAHLETVRSSDFALSQLGFSLSPRGDELAVAGRDGLAFFSLGRSAPLRVGGPQASRVAQAASH